MSVKIQSVTHWYLSRWKSWTITVLIQVHFNKALDLLDRQKIAPTFERIKFDHIFSLAHTSKGSLSNLCQVLVSGSEIKRWSTAVWAWVEVLTGSNLMLNSDGKSVAYGLSPLLFEINNFYDISWVAICCIFFGFWWRWQPQWLWRGPQPIRWCQAQYQQQWQ